MAYVNPSMLQNIQPGGYYPVGNAQFGAGATIKNIVHPNDDSDSPDDWTNTEQLKMFVWFMKMHHEEDIKGFKAMRDIERSVERAEREEMMRKQFEIEQKLWAMQQTQAAQATQPGYTYTATTTTPTKESLWQKIWNKI
jgi:hypothetical protein